MKRNKRLTAVAIFFALLFLFPLSVNAEELRAGGTPFGVRLFTDGVAVVGLKEAGNCLSPAEAAGVRIGDTILTVDGAPVHSVAEVTRAVDASGGKEVTLTLRRKEETVTVKITPQKTEQGYRLGIYIRDSMAGIGTLTFIDPKTGAFGGLGHGIGDPATGAPVKITRGAVLDVKLSEVVRGKAGAPGELRGSLGRNKCGTLLQNNECGVFGILQNKDQGKLYPVGKREDLHCGDAKIITTLKDGETREYSIKISDIHRDRTTKCFTVKVTDKALLAQTGGIVQGMSGSPIIQDGKLVGAVTHVLVSDPTRGYGIFIENMLNASGGARNELPKSA